MGVGSKQWTVKTIIYLFNLAICYMNYKKVIQGDGCQSLYFNKFEAEMLPALKMESTDLPFDTLTGNTTNHEPENKQVNAAIENKKTKVVTYTYV